MIPTVPFEPSPVSLFAVNDTQHGVNYRARATTIAAGGTLTAPQVIVHRLQPE